MLNVDECCYKNIQFLWNLWEYCIFYSNSTWQVFTTTKVYCCICVEDFWKRPSNQRESFVFAGPIILRKSRNYSDYEYLKVLINLSILVLIISQQNIKEINSHSTSRAWSRTSCSWNTRSYLQHYFWICQTELNDLIALIKENTVLPNQ